MTDWFLNPWSMAAGGALVASPIVIHLINRIRYKRVRWAAMEFLLKAQKRVRRKLILQQLLLLLMRIVAVLLIGLLVARFFGFGGAGDEARAGRHYVILDDTPSMADGRQSEAGVPSTALQDAKTVLLEQIVRNAGQATTPQTMVVYRLSELGEPFVVELNDVTQAETRLKTYLNQSNATLLRVPLIEGLKRIQADIDVGGGDSARIVHVLSDYRAVDWSESSESLREAIAQLTAAKVKVNLVDTAHPFRKKNDRRAPAAHDNIAVTEFTPLKLSVAQYETVEFTLRVKNFGAAEVIGLRFAIKVNGDENKGRSVEIERLPGFEERVVKVEIPFDRLATDDKPWDRFSLVTVNLETNEPGGLSSDNLRHAVVEVKNRLPILAIEGRPNLKDSKDGDGFYLRPVFTQVLGGYSWVNGTPTDLEKPDLDKYAFVLLLNVPTLGDAAAKSLEAYAKAGGGVGFFLGPDVRSADYNKLLYRDGEGLFPVPLAEQPSPELSEDEIQTRRFRISQKKLLVREPSRRSHPALAGLYTDERGEPVKDAEELERIFGFLSIRRYWPVQRIGNWREDRSVTELYSLPNERSPADYEEAVRKISDALPIDDAEFAKQKEILAGYRNDLRRIAVSSEPLYKLAAILDDLLADQRGAGNSNETLLREFWNTPRLAELKAQAVRLREAVKFGDPFYLAREYGRGRVTLITTTAGETWSDWPSASPGNATFSPIIKELGTYLSGAGTGENRALGQDIELKLEAARYRPTATRAFLTHVPTPGQIQSDPAPLVPLGDQPLTAEAGNFLLRFREAKNPGAYLFRLTQIRAATATGGEGGEAAEYRAFAANMDAGREGDLRRASRDDIAQIASGAQLVAADDTDWVKELRKKQSDLSDSIWLVVALGLLLLAEQYLSTKLSYNTADETTTAPSAASAFREARVGTPTAAEALKA